MRHFPPHLRTAPQAWALLLCGLVGACGGEAERPLRPRGVLLISIDSLRADHLGCYGYESATAPELRTSPRIDALAEEGSLFERAVSTTSWTLPAHMAMLTGQPNELHGVRDFHQRLHPSHPLLAEVFQQAGWRTAGFWSGPNVSPEFGFGRGFERYVDCSGLEALDPALLEATQADEPDEAAVQALQDWHAASHRTTTGPLVVGAFEEFLGSVEADQPFFAFAHLWDVHYDWMPPAEFDVFDPDYEGPVVSGEYDRLGEMLGRPPAERDLDHLRALYDGELLFTDGQVGRMLDLLSAAGRLDDTLVVLTSDHGEAFYEHKRIGHKFTLYEEEVRIPLVLRWPARVPAGRRSDALVSVIDLVPTVLELCDLAPPAGLWGRSLVGALEGELSARPAPMELTSLRARLELRGLHADQHKVVWRGANEPPKVYDLQRDPGEQTPLGPRALSAGDPRVPQARQVWRTLDEAAAELERLEGELSPELAQRLEAAGYLGGADDED